MENSQNSSSNTNTKSTSDSDNFNVPVSTSPMASSPTLSDFKPPSNSSGDPSLGNSNMPSMDSNFSKGSPGPMPDLDMDDSDQSRSKLSAPIHGQNYGNKGSKTMTIVLAIIILLVMIGGIYGVYSWQHGKITTADKLNSALNLEVSSLQTQVNSANKNLATAQAALNNNVIDVSALGISVNVPSTLKDLTLATKTNPTKLTVSGASVTPTEVDLSSTSLVALDSACSTANGALGVLSKTTGTYPTAPTSTNSSGTLIEQFSGYYIAYSAPAACSKTASTNTTQTSLVTDLQSALIKSNIVVLQ